MSSKTDNSPGWKDFTPLTNTAPNLTSTDPKQPSTYVRERGGCQFCKSRRFLRSGLRGADIGSLFLLRYPVRCLRCRQRQFTDFLTASLSQPAGSPVYSNSKTRENWGTWTRGSNREIIDSWDNPQQQSKPTPPSNR
jgi:hypothetical protein